MTPIRNFILEYADHSYEKIFSVKEGAFKKLPVRTRDHYYDCLLLINIQVVARIKAVCYDVFRNDPNKRRNKK